MISGKLKLKICIFGPFFMSLTFEVPYLNENCLNFKDSRNSICPPQEWFGHDLQALLVKLEQNIALES